MDRYPYYKYTILLGATRALAHIGVHFTHRVFGLSGAQEIIKHREPFNQGESPAAHLEQLYLTMLRMPVEVRVKGKGEKYVISIPAYACKEDLKQAIEDGMLIRNRNFVQSMELV